MVLAQAIVALGLFAMAAVGPTGGLVWLGAFALAVAFASATQDIVIDAWRIESAVNDAELGLFSSAYQLGYRMALLATDALILISATRIGWPASYLACGIAMAVGLGATLFATEPLRADVTAAAKSREMPLWTGKGLVDAIAGPFIMFFRTHGWLALLMLAAISLYRLPDFIMGPMANPFYHDIGLSKDYVGAVRGTIGVVAALLGIAAGGACAFRFGSLRALIVGGILQALAIAAFAVLATGKPSVLLFATVMSGDNFSTGFAGVALVSYMSSLTSLGYTATQYALLSSTYAWAGKILKGFSGAIVEQLAAAHGLMQAYAVFFIGAGAIGVPAVILFLLLAVCQRRMRAGATP
jgi:MFS transporter, PAT family, beta-lactamase induction signal transducer AmpG